MFGIKKINYYKKGDYKIHKHHLLVNNIMNENGAKLWLHFMKKSLYEYKSFR